MPRFVCRGILHDFPKLFIGKDRVFVAGKNLLVPNGHNRLFVCAFLRPSKRAFTPFDQESAFVFLQQVNHLLVNALQIVKHSLPLEPILQRETLWFRVLRINNAAAYLVAGEKLCRRTLVADKYAPIIIPVAEGFTLYAGVLLHHVLVIAFLECLVTQRMPDQFYPLRVKPHIFKHIRKVQNRHGSPSLFCSLFQILPHIFSL